MKNHHHDDDENRRRSRRIVADGEAVRVSLAMMDGLDPVQRAIAARPLVTDTDGGSAGLHRPGFRVVANDARQAMYDAYDAEKSREYLGDAREYPIEAEGSADSGLTLDALENRHQKTMSKIYQQLDADLANAWRNPR